MKVLSLQLEEDNQKRSNIQSDLTSYLSEISKLKSKEKQLTKEANDLRETKKYLEDELYKLRT